MIVLLSLAWDFTLLGFTPILTINCLGRSLPKKPCAAWIVCGMGTGLASAKLKLNKKINKKSK
jgi:hypothetical protein